jgi:hypothetical protein
MAANDPYKPDFVTLAGNSTTFDGTDSATGAALINELSGKTDANIFIEESNDGGTNWEETTQLTDANGNNTFSADWHSQFNRILVVQDERRVKITDVGTGGNVSVTGDER